MGLTELLLNREAAALEKQGKHLDAIASYAEAQNLPAALQAYHVAEKELGKETMDNLGFGPFYEVSALQTLAVDLDFEPIVWFNMLDAYGKYSSGEYTDRNSNLKGRELGRAKVRQMFLRNAMRHNMEPGFLQKLGFEGAEFATALWAAEKEAYDVSSLENIADSYLRYDLCGAGEAIRLANKLQHAREGERAIRIYKKVRALEPERKEDCDYAISRCKEDCMPKTRDAAWSDYYLGFVLGSIGVTAGGAALGNVLAVCLGNIFLDLAFLGFTCPNQLSNALSSARGKLYKAQHELCDSRKQIQDKIFSGVYLNGA